MRRTGRAGIASAALGRADRDDPPAPPGGELHDAGGARVERVVAAHAHAVARLEPASALADDDLAAGHRLAGEDLDAQALGVAVAPVARGAETLLMRHRRGLPSLPRPRRSR